MCCDMLLTESGHVAFQEKDEKIYLLNVATTCETGNPAEPEPISKKSQNSQDMTKAFRTRLLKISVHIHKLLAFKAGLLALYNEDDKGFVL